MYATRADLEERFGETEIANLADGDGGAERVTAALTDASGEIDGVLPAAGYLLPLPEDREWPLLQSLACDLARGRLYDNTELEIVGKRMREARRQLGMIKDGTTRVVDAAGREAPRRPLALRAGAPPVMTPDALRGL